MDEALTDLNYLILLALLKPQHGYGIMKEVSEKTEGLLEIGPASMYTILKKLQQEKLIQLEQSTNRKKIYRITELGVKRLKSDLRRRRLLHQVGEEMLETFEGEEGKNEDRE